MRSLNHHGWPEPSRGTERDDDPKAELTRLHAKLAQLADAQASAPASCGRSSRRSATCARGCSDALVRSPRGPGRFLGELDAWAEVRDPGCETVAYGGHPDQVADVRRGGERNAILLHGGFWRPEWTRSTTRALAVDLAVRGWTSWNVEYRRSGLEDMLADVAAALERCGAGTVIGHSAGGHLALWAAATGRRPASCRSPA